MANTNGCNLINFIFHVFSRLKISIKIIVLNKHKKFDMDHFDIFIYLPLTFFRYFNNAALILQKHIRGILFIGGCSIQML